MATDSRKRPLDSLTTARLNTLTTSPSQSTFPSQTTSTTHNTTTSFSNPQPAKKPRLTQLTLDLGQKVHTKCKTCGMNYILSSDEDRRLHKRYHDSVVVESTEGIALTKAAGEGGRVVKVCGVQGGRGGVKRDVTGAKRMVENGGGIVRAETKHGATTVPRGSSRMQGTQERDVNTHDQDHILEIRRSDPRPLKTLARRVLEAAETALGAVPVEEKQLWSEIAAEGAGADVDSAGTRKTGSQRQTARQRRQKRTVEQGTTKMTKTADGCEGKDVDGAKGLNDRYRVYLYIHAQKCVGLLLAERICTARVVLAPEMPTVKALAPTTASASASSTLLTPPPSSPPPSDELHTSTPLMASTTPVPARMGISRIWVLPTFRGKGVAAKMLEGAMEAFAEGESMTPGQSHKEGGVEGRGQDEEGKVEERKIGYKKENVAFSQPTEMGRKLAERWWGAEGGWLVYD